MKISSVVGVPYTKSLPITADPLSLPSNISRNDIIYDIFKLVATTLVPTDSSKEPTSMFDNRYSKQSTETRKSGQLEHTQCSGQNESQYANEWVVHPTSQSPDPIHSSPSTFPKQHIYNHPPIPSYRHPISLPAELSHSRNAPKILKNYSQKSIVLDLMPQNVSNLP